MKKPLLLLLCSIFFTSTFLFSACSKSDSKGSNGAGQKESIFKGQNLVTFGNSITAASDGWAYKVHRTLGFANLYNGAVGGAIWSKRARTATGGVDIKTQNYNDPDFAGISNSNAANPSVEEYQKRINNCAIVHIQKYLATRSPSISPDYIIISYGTNDSATDAVIGDADAVLAEADLANVDTFTMAGAIRWCIEMLRTEFPNMKLYIALPLQAKSESKNEGNLKKMAVITKICDAMSVPYFDCYNESGITKENESKYLGDGLHPNDAGKVVQGNYISQKLLDANKK